MLASPLPTNPSLEQLRKQAKQLRDDARSGRENPYKKVCEAREIARDQHPRWADATSGWEGFTLADAQLVIARSHGFPSWRRLREHVLMVIRYARSPQRRPASDTNLVDEFLRLACLTYYVSRRSGEDVDNLDRQVEARRMLAAHPALASAGIHTAAAVGDVATARSLLAEDETLANQEGGPHSWPPLLYATSSRLDSAGHSTLEVARLLLAHGADPNAGYLPDGETPPVTALSCVFRGHADPMNQPAHQHSLPLARLLLAAGADPNDSRAMGNACGYPHDDAGLSLLLDHGLGRGSAGPWRTLLGHRLSTPAHLVQDELRRAAQFDLPNRARLLLRRCAEAGIDLNTAGALPDDPCRTAYEFAVVGGNTEVADLLTRAGAHPTPLEETYQLVAACMRADRRAMDKLLVEDPGLAERTVGIEWWPDPVHQAAILNRPAALTLLVSLGFPISGGQPSPLHHAALTGSLDVVRLLVEYGADTAAEATDDRPGRFRPDDPTPLGWARYAGQHEVVAYLSSLPPSP